jgi:CubicO group peptidase (beta-lactamase class C family)
MDLERGKPMRDDTIFRIYSMTKPITSVAIMMLYERGHFQLNDPVWRFIPQWHDLQVYQAGVVPNFMSQAPLRAMTIRDLLTHMSGLTYGFMNRTNVDHAYRRLGVSGAAPGMRADNAAENLEDMVDRLARIPLEFSPGTRWNYSVSTDILGHLVEVISGQRFDTFLKQHIFDPLGMTDTGFVVDETNVPRFAANYQRSADKRLVCTDDPEDSIYIRPRSMLSGGGGLASTAGDYLKFTRMLLNGGELDGARILGRKTIEMMTCNLLPDNEDLTRWALGTFSETANEGYGFGLGFSINLGPSRTSTIGSAGEYAWGGAASTIFWVDPAEQLIVIFMTQFMPSATFNFRGQMKSLVYPAIID